MVSLPPLPPAGHTRPSYIYNADNEICGHALPILYYTADQLREYGQQCRAAALEEAALACESAIASIWDYHDDGRKQIGATVCNNLAAAIRALREST